MASSYDGVGDRFIVHQRRTGRQGEEDPLLPGLVQPSYSPTMSSLSPLPDNSLTIAAHNHSESLEYGSHRSPLTGDESCINGGGAFIEPSRNDNESRASDHCHKFEEMGDDLTARNQLITVSVLCFLFMSAEIVGGLLAGSLAVATDATHMASDLAGFLISLFAIWLKKRPATQRLSFGFYRAEVLGALISILIIWVVTAVLVVLAVGRVQDQTFKIDSKPMLITASIGVAFNIVMGAVLHFKQCNIKSAFGHGHSHGGGHGHSHSGGHGHSHDGGHGHSHSGHSSRGHGHSHAHHSSGHGHQPVESMVINSSGSNRHSVLSLDSSADDDRLIISDDCNDSVNGEPLVDVSLAPKMNINVRAALVHVIGDLIQSIGVLVAAIVIHLSPNSKIADPICTFIFSFLVLCTTFGVLRDILIIILEGVPRDVDYKAMKLDLQRIPGVQMAHSLNVWSLTMDAVVVNVHLAVACDVRWQEITFKAAELLRNKYQVFQSTIQVEEYQQSVMSTCRKCQFP